MSDATIRPTLIEQLGDEIKPYVDNNGTLRLFLSQLVSVCASFGHDGLVRLRKAVVWVEGNTEAMKAVMPFVSPMPE